MFFSLLFHLSLYGSLLSDVLKMLTMNFGLTESWNVITWQSNYFTIFLFGRDKTIIVQFWQDIFFFPGRSVLHNIVLSVLAFGKSLKCVQWVQVKWLCREMKQWIFFSFNLFPFRLFINLYKAFVWVKAERHPGWSRVAESIFTIAINKHHSRDLCNFRYLLHVINIM